MSQRCHGKNCKHAMGFDVPHSPECEFGDQPVREQDNSCGPNNINVLNPDQEDVSSLGSAEYMKLLALAMYKLGVKEIVITPDIIDEYSGMDAVVCIANMEDGIHISTVSMEEAEAIAKEQRGSLH